MLKRTPLFEQHKKLGAKMAPFAGWEMPISYKSIIEEHHAVRKRVGIFDVGHMGLIKVSGDHALDLVQQVTTNDAAKLEVNQCMYSALCNENGGAIDDVLVYRLPMLYLVISNASNTGKVLGWLNEQAKKHKDVAVSLYGNYCILSVQGPKANEVVGKVLGCDTAQIKRNHAFWWRDILVSRTGYTGEDGLELIVDKNKAEKIWDLFLQAGAQPCGLGARDTLRLEAGLPLYGHEYDEKTSPLEVGYGWAVKFDKGEFIGKSALLAQKEGSLPKKLIGLLPEGRSIPRAGDLVFAGEKEVGRVTSGTFSPTLKRPIALAFLAPDAALPGNSVEIEVRGKKFPAKIVAKTFYKR
jgi:aminomethyltransferase